MALFLPGKFDTPFSFGKKKKNEKELFTWILYKESNAISFIYWTSFCFICEEFTGNFSLLFSFLTNHVGRKFSEGMGTKNTGFKNKKKKKKKREKQW